MRIGIIGATRGIGLELTKLALAHDHTVAVMVRRGRAPEANHPRLRAVRGDVRDIKAVERLVRGCDAVILTLGLKPTLRPVSVFSTGTRNVVNAMHKYSVSRLLVVTGITAGNSRGKGGFLFEQVVRPLLLDTIYADKDRQEKVVRESELDWTIVRPGFLTNGIQTGSFQELENLNRVKKASKISRKDVAYYLLRETKSRRSIEKTIHLMK